MKKSLLTIIVSLGVFNLVIAQSNKPETSISVEGQISIAANGDAVLINIGGPAIKFVFPKFALAANLLPSLKFQEDGVRPLVIPLLGIGPQLYFLKDKRFILSIPCYYNVYENKWKVSGGIGYVLTKPNK